MLIVPISLPQPDFLYPIYEFVTKTIFTMSTQDWIESFMQWFIVITGIIGQLLVIKKNVAGFWFWVASNISMAIASAFKGYYGMVVLYVFYIFMCFYGLKEWRKTDKANLVSLLATKNKDKTERIDPE